MTAENKELVEALSGLCKVIEKLRQEVAELRADRTVHHYHHQAAPAPFAQPGPTLHPTYYPRWEPNTSAGSCVSSALGLGLTAINAA